jgi:putative transposase
MGKLLAKIRLSEEEQVALKMLVSKGRHSVRKIKRAQLLLKLHQGKAHEEVAQEVGVCLATVYNIHNRYISDKLAALEEKPRPGQVRKVTPEVEAAITRIACSQAPEGRSRWTISLIHERIVALGYELTDESVRLALKKASLSLG